MTDRERNAEERALRVIEEKKRSDAKLKWHVDKLFGRNNIMFECVAERNQKPNRMGCVYNITCKLCGHVTKREQRTKMLFVCGGCYREWDKEEDEILMPNNNARISLARKNGKLVLPCDDVSEDAVDVAPIVSPEIDVSVRTFTHVVLRPGQFYQIGDYVFEYVD